MSNLTRSNVDLHHRNNVMDTVTTNRFADSLHSLSQMIFIAAQLHRQSTEMLITLLQSGANITDQIQTLRAYEELYVGYLTRIIALAETLRVGVIKNNHD